MSHDTPAGKYSMSTSIPGARDAIAFTAKDPTKHFENDGGFRTIAGMVAQNQALALAYRAKAELAAVSDRELKDSELPGWLDRVELAMAAGLDLSGPIKSIRRTPDPSKLSVKEAEAKLSAAGPTPPKGYAELVKLAQTRGAGVMVDLSTGTADRINRIAASLKPLIVDAKADPFSEPILARAIIKMGKIKTKKIETLIGASLGDDVNAVFDAAQLLRYNSRDPDECAFVIASAIVKASDSL